MTSAVPFNAMALSRRHLVSSTSRKSGLVLPKEPDNPGAAAMLESRSSRHKYVASDKRDIA